MGKDCKKPNGYEKKTCDKGNHNKPNKPERKKSIEDCCFCIGSVNRVSDYDDASQFIMRHTKKTCNRCNDVSEVLRIGIKPDAETWKPALEHAASTAMVDNTRLNKQREMTCKMDYDACLKRKEKSDQNSIRPMLSYGKDAQRQ